MNFAVSMPRLPMEMERMKTVNVITVKRVWKFASFDKTLKATRKWSTT